MRAWVSSISGCAQNPVNEGTKCMVILPGAERLRTVPIVIDRADLTYAPDQ